MSHLLRHTAIALLFTAPFIAQPAFAAEMTEEQVKKIVETYINEHPEVIVESLQKWQLKAEADRNKEQEEAVAKISAVFKEDKHFGIAGNPKGDVTVVEFFDYDCGACKMMFESIDGLIKQDKNVRVVFVEYPIFGPSSDANARIGLAVAALAPDKYYAFHEGLMRYKGRVTTEAATEIAKNLGIDEAKLKAEIKKPIYTELLAENRKLGEQLKVQGTPAAIIGNTMVNSALSVDDLKTQIEFQRAAKKK